MIEQIISTLKGELSKKFTGEYGMQQDKVDDAVMLAQKDIMDTVKDEVGRGNFNGLMSLLQQKDQIATNPIVTNMVRKYAGDLGSKLGLDPQLASTVASFAIPFILKKFVSSTEENGLDMGSLMAMFSGPKGEEDLNDKLKGQFGDSLGGFFK